jgi:hydrogenase expression/formation protein HypD
MGVEDYRPVAARYRVPIVVTGFEPVDLLLGMLRCVTQLEQNRAEVENAYERAVRPEGNLPARRLLEEVFEVIPRTWRGIGEIPASGWGLRAEFEDFDAEKRFDVVSVTARESQECLSGLVLRGLKKPTECPAFGGRCTPDHPLGATMVSSEGACAAYHRYRGGGA